jgi:hypothetical protein
VYKVFSFILVVGEKQIKMFSPIAKLTEQIQSDDILS